VVKTKLVPFTVEATWNIISPLITAPPTSD
jgi:hypothetical protein